MGLEMKDLQKAATNLNVVLGLSPKIKINGKKTVLEENIREASLEVVPGDYVQQDDDPVLSEYTKEVLNALQEGNDNNGNTSKTETEVTQVEVETKVTQECFGKDYVKTNETCKKCEQLKDCRKTIRTNKKKEPKEVDQFGFRKGSKTSLFIESITKQPMTMAEVKELDWNTKNNTFYESFKRIVKDGFGFIDDDKKMSIKEKK